MSDKIFLDTNILIYLYSIDEKEKRKKAIDIFKNTEESLISNQVINEFINVLFKKFKSSSIEIEKTIYELQASIDIVQFGTKTQLDAIRIKDRYNLQFYDALIIATAIENKCNILYSEDMHNGIVIDNILKIINPFK